MAGDYDLIVIGSGMGGMTVASLATQLLGKRVLLLEQHWRAGGFTHAFRREGWRWDVGLHYLGGLKPGSDSRRLFDLVTGGKIELRRLPDRYDVVHACGASYGIPSDLVQMEAELAARFPADAVGLRRYFRLMQRINRSFGPALYAASAPEPPAALIRLGTWRTARLARRTTAEVIDSCVSDPKLKLILGGRWGDYGVVPCRSAFGYHAQILGSYADGAWYPEGGGSVIADAVTTIVRDGGGEVRVNARVDRVLVEQGRAIGVEMIDGHGRANIMRAPLIVSDAGLHRTLAMADLPPAPAALEQSPSAVTVYLGLSDDPRKLGVDGANHWFVADTGHGDGLATLAQLQDGSGPMAFASFSSAVEAGATTHSAQLLMLVDRQAFADWQGSQWRQRGDDYTVLKDRIADAAVARLDAAFPGFAQFVAYREVSTPLTVNRFTGHAGAAIYGLAVTPQRLAACIGAKTPLPRLLLTGADVCTPGVQGAMMGGVFATAAMVGASGLPQIMAAARADRSASRQS